MKRSLTTNDKFLGGAALFIVFLIFMSLYISFFEYLGRKFGISPLLANAIVILLLSWRGKVWWDKQ